MVATRSQGPAPAPAPIPVPAKRKAKKQEEVVEAVEQQQQPPEEPVPWKTGFCTLFVGEYPGKGEDMEYWRRRLGWVGEGDIQPVYYRYEAVGNPTEPDDGEVVLPPRFIWVVGRGLWEEKREYFRQRRGWGVDESVGPIASKKKVAKKKVTKKPAAKKRGRGRPRKGDK